ncbi:MAG: hypothetical protein AAFP07_11145 [Cyanobacteria bacterium J06606_4]
MAEGSDDKKSILGQIVVAVVVALLAGGTSPWWVDRFFGPKEPAGDGPSQVGVGGSGSQDPGSSPTVEPPVAPPAEPPTEPPIEPAPPEAPAFDTTITGEGFGDAKLCMTGGELRRALPELNFQPYLGDGPLVDTEGVTVTNQNGDIAFYALAVVGEGPKLNILVTDNPDYKTTEGIGPQTLVREATLDYGAPTLYYSVYNESREYVRFAYGPEDIDFRTGSSGAAGIYTSRSEYNETTSYQPEARIREVWLSRPTCD